jgi:hypothetical protein
MSGTQNLDGNTRPVEELLDELQRESELRRAELREIAAQLPAAMSRRAILRSIAADLRRAPGKSDIVTRAVRKVGRMPGKAARTVSQAMRPDR